MTQREDARTAWAAIGGRTPTEVGYDLVRGLTATGSPDSSLRHVPSPIGYDGVLPAGSRPPGRRGADRVERLA